MQSKTHLIIDISLVGLSTVCAFVVRNPDMQSAAFQQGLGLYLAISIGASAVFFVWFRISAQVWRYVSFRETGRIFLVVSLTVMVAWFATFLINRADPIPRSVPLLQVGLAFALVLGIRIVARLRAALITTHQPSRAHRSQTTSVLIVGSSVMTDIALRCIDHLADGKVRVAGILDENHKLQGRRISSVDVIGHPRDVHSVVNTQAVHGVIIDKIIIADRFASLSEESRQALDAYQIVSNHPMVFLEEHLSALVGPFSSELQQSSDRLQTVQSLDPVIKRPGYLPLKRTLDIVGSATLLIATAPSLIVLWLVVKSTLGTPTYFWQVRPGKNGVAFRLLKFRTMRDAHDHQGTLLTDEQRSTTIGRVLRRYRFDELLQLINVLKGDMSFVGPRPLLPRDQPTDSSIRLKMRPGITGWAQVNGGRWLSIDDKTKLDEYYVQEVSFKLDVMILLKTVRIVLSGETPPTKGILRLAQKSQQRLQSREISVDENRSASGSV